MKVLVLCAVGTLSAALIATAASGARQPFPGRLIALDGIGQLRLGMSASAAQRVLQRVATPYPKRDIAVRPGVDYVELEYRRDVFAVDYVAGFLGPPGKRRLVMIGTLTARERTREGIRVGATYAQLVRTYRARLSCRVISRAQACTLGSSSTRHLVFVVNSTVELPHNPSTPRRVRKILVRERGLRVTPD